MDGGLSREASFLYRLRITKKAWTCLPPFHVAQRYSHAGETARLAAQIMPPAFVSSCSFIEGFRTMKSNRLLGLVLLVAAGFMVTGLAAGHGGDTMTNKQIMAKVNGPKGVFAALKKELSQSQPNWADVTKESKEIVELTEALAKNAPRKGSQASWEKLTEAYTKNAKTLVDAADKMDLKAAKAAQQAIASSCTGCHRVHK
jgi:hypothetical protein